MQPQRQDDRQMVPLPLLSLPPPSSLSLPPFQQAEGEPHPSLVYSHSPQYDHHHAQQHVQHGEDRHQMLEEQLLQLRQDDPQDPQEQQQQHREHLSHANFSEYFDHYMQTAQGIVRRYHERGGLLPLYSKDHPKEQECCDATVLINWKQAIRNKSMDTFPTELINYLDKEIPNWKDTSHKNIEGVALMKAQGIFERYEKRGKILPRDVRSGAHLDELSRRQESSDAARLNYWKNALKAPDSSHKCPDAVKRYLDANMPGWTDKIRIANKQPMDFALEIVRRYIARGNVLPREIKHRRGDPEKEEEYRDATKLRNWKKALRGSGTHMCSEELMQFLDTHMPEWRKPKTDKVHVPLQFARDIVTRVQQRQGVLPRELKDTRNDPDRIQEYKDACKLNNWKKSLRGIGTHCCPEHIQNYLDEHIPTWRNRASGNGGGGKKRTREKEDIGGPRSSANSRVRVQGSVGDSEDDLPNDGLLISVGVDDTNVMLGVGNDGVNGQHVLLGRNDVSLGGSGDDEAAEQHDSLLELANMENSSMQQAMMQTDMQLGNSMSAPNSEDIDAEDINIVNDVLTAQI